jgi:hypothetical protein
MILALALRSRLSHTKRTALAFTRLTALVTATQSLTSACVEMEAIIDRTSVFAIASVAVHLTANATSRGVNSLALAMKI